ncbi:DUF6635 family protein [Roseivivax isoporae]|uniref:Uncharacterized protein n=1 Tax=Roseivivax isoporae LMG 25204 TaxID=1449351 RepID=X7F292_9RHOB|nr:DUF6635 family protein [Roseivivax isoporae]ETX26905.1 hypothetical protein RISW2_17690 [Roseivivax isoporae LMG 25204]
MQNSDDWPGPDDATLAARRAAVVRFVRDTYGPRGTLSLHRAALGLDLLRAPVNVALSPVFLLTRLVALVLGLLRMRRAAGWLMTRRIFLETAVARRLRVRLGTFLDALAAAGLAPRAAPDMLDRAIADYAGVRGAVSEITTSLVVVLTGFWVFGTATPGVVSLTGPVAEELARAQAVQGFWAGQTLGRAWYGVFPARLSPFEVVAIGFSLAMIGSVVTTFAGLVADPVQLWTGMHRRRLWRMLRRLDRAAAGDGAGLAPEHLVARLGDIGDALTGLWRALRG